jgi:hypothetical protein
MTNNIKKFCEEYGACKEGRQWELSNFSDMTEVWDKLCASEDVERSKWLIWIMTREGVCDDKILRLFAVFCCTIVLDSIKNNSKKSVFVALRNAFGLATDKELEKAHDDECNVEIDEFIQLIPFKATQENACEAAWYSSTHIAWNNGSKEIWLIFQKWIREFVKNPFRS